MLRTSLLTALVCALAACGTDPTSTPEESAAIRDPLLMAPVQLCLPSSTAPQIFSNTIMSPAAIAPGATLPTGVNPTSARASRGGVEYVSGTGVRMELVTDTCVYFKEVRIGSRVLTPSYTNGYWYSVQASTNPPADTSKQGWNLWVFFPPTMDGLTERVTITLGRSNGTATASTGFNLSRVESVEGAWTPVQAAISRAELQNMFGKAIAAQFNWPTNSAVLTTPDGAKRHIYAYNPASLNVAVDGSGVSFSFDFAAEGSLGCNPGVTAYGKFRVVSDLGKLRLEWVTPAQATLHWSTACEALQLVPILGLIPAYLFEQGQVGASAGLKASLETSINDSLAASASQNVFITGTSSSSNELDVTLALPLTSVRVRTAYDAFDLPGTFMGFGSGQHVAIFGRSLGVNDYVAGITPQTTLWSGPNGVPRAGTTTWPRAYALARTGALPWDTAPVARMLMRATQGGLVALPTTTTWNYTPGCSVTTYERFGLFNLRFGVNEIATDAQRLRGIFGAAPGYEVRVVFLDEGGSAFVTGAKACESRTTGGPIVIAVQ